MLKFITFLFALFSPFYCLTSSYAQEKYYWYRYTLTQNYGGGSFCGSLNFAIHNLSAPIIRFRFSPIFSDADKLRIIKKNYVSPIVPYYPGIPIQKKEHYLPYPMCPSPSFISISLANNWYEIINEKGKIIDISNYQYDYYANDISISKEYLRPVIWIDFYSSYRGFFGLGSRPGGCWANVSLRGKDDFAYVSIIQGIEKSTVLQNFPSLDEIPELELPFDYKEFPIYEKDTNYFYAYANASWVHPNCYNYSPSACLEKSSKCRDTIFSSPLNFFRNLFGFGNG